MLRNLVASLLLTFVVTMLAAQEVERKVVERDTIDYIYTPIDQSYAKEHGSGRLFRKLVEGDPLALVLVPIYCLETNLGIALSGQYKTQTFSVSATAMASLSGYYNVRVEGANTLRQTHRLSYGAAVVSQPTRLWGLTIDAMQENSYKTYTSKEYYLWFQYMLPIAKNTTIDINTDYSYLAAAKLDDGMHILLGNRPCWVSSVSVGAGIDYDSRERLKNYQQRGVYATLSAYYRPQIFSNLSGDMASFEATFDWYQPLWSGATFTFDVHGEHNTSKTPWLMQSSLGGGRLRGYYPGRYRGNSVAMAQVELRQHIWRGIGVVAWGGVGTVFSPADGFAWRKLLPTYGLGLRYYYQDIVLRADVGFGCNSYDILIGLGEAF